MLKVHGLNGTEANRLRALYRATGIKYRHSVIPDYQNQNRQFFPETEDLEPFPRVEQRMDLYRQNALGLALNAIEDCIAQLPAFDITNVTHLITVSCTGMYAPGLDIELVEQLQLHPSVKRIAVNYMGCYAAVNAIKLADSICRSESDANVLIACVELCSLHFQKGNSKDNLLANALFSDGAGAVLQSSQPHDGLKIQPQKFYCHLVRQGKKHMAWSIGNFGFEMSLSSYVPDLIKSGVRELLSGLLQDTGLQLSEVDYFAIHPGGKLILEEVERELDIPRVKNEFPFQVLRDYGNMSSVTILFVLKKILDSFRNSSVEKGTILGMAFGPGLTLESMILSLSRSNH
jgi:predicted naringenin-chalcone synthase